MLNTCAGTLWYYAVDQNIGPFLPYPAPTVVTLDDGRSTEIASSGVVVPAIACFAAALAYLGVDTCSYLLLLVCSIHHVRGAHADFDAFCKGAAKMKLRTPDDPPDDAQLNQVISAGLIPIFRLGIGLGTALKIVSPLRALVLGVVAIASFSVGARCFASFYGACGATATGLCLFWYCSG